MHTLLVAFRVVQGLGGGMLMPLTFTIPTREAGPRVVPAEKTAPTSSGQPVMMH